MADDQKPKTMDINDLVRELSKSSTIPVASTPPLAPSTQAPRPSSPTMVSPAPKPFIPVTPVPPPPVKPTPPKLPETPMPQFNAPLPPLSQVKPAVPATPPSTTFGVKEYQSSIRTMSEDISKLKQGQKPMGVDVPRKVEQVPISKPVVPQPTVPNQQFKVPTVNLGETQKTGPMAQSKDFKPPTAPKVESKQQIYVPPEGGQKGINRNMLFLGIGAMAVVAGFSYWFFVLKSSTPKIVVESPTPTPEVTETPVPTPIPTLTSIFFGTPKQTISITAKNTLASFVGDVTSRVVVDSGSFKMIEAMDVQTPSVSYGFFELLSKLALTIPTELVNNFGIDSAMFIYGQKESFDVNGNLKVGVTAPNRIVIVAEIKDLSSASQIVNAWEASLSSDFNTLFSLGKASKVQIGFLDNSYQGVSIRYKNFPYADITIDYSIVQASNGKTYFVIADSREAMYATIGKLK